jgi:hypothetical protein
MHHNALDINHIKLQPQNVLVSKFLTSFITKAESLTKIAKLMNSSLLSQPHFGQVWG